MGFLSFRYLSNGRTKTRGAAPGNICQASFNDSQGQPASSAFLEDKKCFKGGAIVTHYGLGATSTVYWQI